MNILPTGILTEDIMIEEFIEPSKTYKIDFEDGKIIGLCDGIEALKQAAILILQTERFQHLIYSDNYGSEFKNIIGLDRNIAESEHRRVIREALTQDYRIEEVDNFIFNYHKDSVTIEFTILSILGNFEMRKVVS